MAGYLDWPCVHAFSPVSWMDWQTHRDFLFSQLGRESEDLHVDMGLRNQDSSTLTLRIPTGLRIYTLAHTERSDSSSFESLVKQSFSPHSFSPLTITIALLSTFKLGVLRLSVATFLSFHCPLDFASQSLTSFTVWQAWKPGLVRDPCD
jgi:hypothetical protein